MCFVSDLLRNINDPEHPLTLEELNVVEYRHIQVSKQMQHQPYEYICFQPLNNDPYMLKYWENHLFFIRQLFSCKRIPNI